MNRNIGLIFNNIVFHFLVLIIMNSCSFNSNDSFKQDTDKECINTPNSTKKKLQLENGIREQVKFMGEKEELTSITDRMTKYNIPALSLTVINNGKIEWAEIYQNENFTYETPLNCTSIFQAASLSKPVTFMAAVRMQAAGKIDMDKNIQEYLKNFVIPLGKQTPENPVTFRNIFSHTSGINPGGYEGYDKTLPMPSDIDILKGSEGVNTKAIEVISAPNETLAYSGGGYTLAELALQDIFDDKFSNIMQKWILKPVGMNHSEFTQPLPHSDSVRAAKGHYQSGEIVEGGWRNYPQQAAAGLWSNSIDLAKFMIEIYNAYQGKKSLFSQEEIKSIINDELNRSVYGFILDRSEDDISITHYGGNTGYRTGMTISLTSGKGLVYLINSDNGVALGNELILSAAQVYKWKHFKQTEVYRKQVESEILQKLAGNYKWNNQVDLTIAYKENNNQISLFFPNGDEYELIPIIGEELEFIHPNTGVRVSFLQNDEYKTFKLYGQTAVKLDVNHKKR